MDEGSRKLNVYQRVTDEIVQAIEAGAPTFTMPWHQGANAGMPRNACTGHHYRGVNTLALWSAAQLRGYEQPYWASYRQWASLGAHVRRGERSTAIVFYKHSEIWDSTESDPTPGRTVLRYSSVFNAAQVEGWTYPEVSREDRTERIAKADSFVHALGAEIVFGGGLAFYSPRFDRIHMPNRRTFIGTGTSTETEAFYATLFHEHVHWSGHASRLKRDLSGRFGTSSYAIEELVAELGAAFLCAELDITVHPRKDHAAYVANWLIVLKQQKSAIFAAAREATAACDYLSELQTRAISATG